MRRLFFKFVARGRGGAVGDSQVFFVIEFPVANRKGRGGGSCRERRAGHLKIARTNANDHPGAADSQTEISKGLGASTFVKSATASLAVSEDSDFYFVKYGVVHRSILPPSTVLLLIYEPSEVNSM